MSDHGIDDTLSCTRSERLNQPRHYNPRNCKTLAERKAQYQRFGKVVDRKNTVVLCNG